LRAESGDEKGNEKGYHKGDQKGNENGHEWQTVSDKGYEKEHETQMMI